VQALLPPESHDPLDLNSLYWADIGGILRWVYRRGVEWYFGETLGTQIADLIVGPVDVAIFDYTI
jgi:hypothetical protein